VDCNESFELLTGYKKEEIIGKSSLQINFWTHPVDRSQIVESLFKEGFAQIQGLELTTKSNETKVVDASFVTVNINNELHSISNLLDITERQKAENELKENHSQIENLNEKLKVLGSLTRHDVKNKLMVINGNTYLLRKRLANSPDLLTYLESIEVAINQSDRLLELSRIYEQIGSEKLTKINVEECFKQAFNLINKPGLEMINKCQGLTVNADSMLRQLFYNLIDNSLKHGKTVTGVKLWFNNEASVIKLYYEDNGVGISEANKSLIFSEGFTTGGSGLGLKLVKKMIESYGWTIEENGIPSKGARFLITIPKSALFY
jgi:PAS domain S-box-containing protein